MEYAHYLFSAKCRFLPELTVHADEFGKQTCARVHVQARRKHRAFGAGIHTGVII